MEKAREHLPALMDHLVELIPAMRRDSEESHEPNGEFRVTCFEHTALATLRLCVDMTFDALHAEFCRLSDARYADEVA